MYAIRALTSDCVCLKLRGGMTTLSPDLRIVTVLLPFEISMPTAYTDFNSFMIFSASGRYQFFSLLIQTTVVLHERLVQPA